MQQVLLNGDDAISKSFVFRSFAHNFPLACFVTLAANGGDIFYGILIELLRSLFFLFLGVEGRWLLWRLRGEEEKQLEKALFVEREYQNKFSFSHYTENILLFVFYGTRRSLRERRAGKVFHFVPNRNRLFTAIDSSSSLNNFASPFNVRSYRFITLDT